MRLGQLARKLALRPTEILEFLAANNIQIDNSSNTKLEEGHLSLILKQFAPDLANDADLEVDVPEVPPEPIKDMPDEIEVPTETNTGLELKADESSVEKTEVIKAAKVELSGLKVLGKIELPDPKTKEESSGEKDLDDKQAPPAIKTEKRNSNFRKDQTNRKSYKNPIALDRERETLETNKNREEEARLRKEKKTLSYLKKVKAHQPTKAAKIINEPVVEMSAADLEEPPKTWWGKVVKWLTT